MATSAISTMLKIVEIVPSAITTSAVTAAAAIAAIAAASCALPGQRRERALLVGPDHRVHAHRGRDPEHHRHPERDDREDLAEDRAQPAAATLGVSERSSANTPRPSIAIPATNSMISTMRAALTRARWDIKGSGDGWRRRERRVGDARCQATAPAAANRTMVG